MKSLAELQAIREKTLNRINLRKEEEGEVTRVVIGMATCGIAAGARPVMLAFMEEIQKRNLQHVTVSQTGCIGMCRYEPMLDVILPKMDGYKILSIIKGNEEFKDIPVIMLTSKDGFLNKMKGKMAGSAAYLTKPFDPDQMLQEIKRHIW